MPAGQLGAACYGCAHGFERGLIGVRMNEHFAKPLVEAVLRLLQLKHGFAASLNDRERHRFPALHHVFKESPLCDTRIVEALQFV